MHGSSAAVYRLQIVKRNIFKSGEWSHKKTVGHIVNTTPRLCQEQTKQCLKNTKKIGSWLQTRANAKQTAALMRENSAGWARRVKCKNEDNLKAPPSQSAAMTKRAACQMVEDEGNCKK